jgi:hypothetical protein
MRCELERHAPFILRLRDAILWLVFVVFVGGVMWLLVYRHFGGFSRQGIRLEDLVDFIMTQTLMVVVVWGWANSLISNLFYWPKWDKEQKRKADIEAYQTKLLGRLEKDLTARKATKASADAMKEKVETLERQVGNLQALNETLIEDLDKLKKDKE